MLTVENMEVVQEEPIAIHRYEVHSLGRDAIATLSPRDAECSILLPGETHFQLSQPGSRRMTGDNAEMAGLHELAIASRRPSAILSALRRPSQAVALSTSQAVSAQRRIVLEILQSVDRSRSMSVINIKENDKAIEARRKNRRIGRDGLSIVLSALYCKFMVVLGIALPVSEILTQNAPASFYQGFYLYMYIVSVAFVAFMYATLARERAVFNIIKSYHQKVDRDGHALPKPRVVRYGSFYLRLGAIAFGIGSMVYTGLEFGQYFELHNDPRCRNVLIALTPAARMILTIVQMQFIFLNTKEMKMGRHKVVARFGLMHLVATNLCEWLYVLVEETKHEIVHIVGHSVSVLASTTVDPLLDNNITSIAENITHHVTKRAVGHDIVVECRRTNIMGKLVQNASPFLFPCTIEYSLICAVILYEMWKKVKVTHCNDSALKKELKRSQSNDLRGDHSFSVDCSNAHKGLFAGILVIVMTIISLIMFYVFDGDDDYKPMALMEITICEMLLYGCTAGAVVWTMFQMRDMKYTKKDGSHSINLDCSLLIMAQCGVFIYCMFSIIGCYYMVDEADGGGNIGIVAEVFSLVQTALQTMFVLDAWSRRCKGAQQCRKKPGREPVTFLLVANMSMWFINTLVKNRAGFRPTHLSFFGIWAWTIITHVSMPLVIFYRFHSTICLFEIWKSAYKVKPSDSIQ